MKLRVSFLRASLVGIALNRAAAQGLPDLVVEPDEIQPFITTETFSPDNCAVDEGCVVSGTRDMLRFSTYTKNTGPGSLVLGDPINNPLFHYHLCHGHYHLEGYAEFRLRDSNGIVANGLKIGFCVRDQIQWDPDANPTPIYDCDFQGIQPGWADNYDASIPCQWIDITDVPAGLYTLEVEVNPDLILTESDYSNNVASIPVLLDDGPPANDACESAIAASDGVYPVNLRGATSTGPNELAGRFANPAAITGDTWYRYTADRNLFVTASLCGSHFDGWLGVYPGACPAAGPIATDWSDDFCSTAPQVTFIAAAGQTYYVRVAALNGDAGLGILTFSSELLNDDCGNVLPVSEGFTPITTDRATTDGPEGGDCGPVMNDVWYLYLARETAEVDFGLCGSNFDSILEIHGEICPAHADDLLACNDDYCGDQSRLRLSVSEGYAYIIRVGGVDGATGSGKLMIARAGFGDMNCDGTSNTFDIQGFVTALTSETQYHNQYPNCDILHADSNGDGTVNTFDVQGFVDLLGMP